jgi:hypothetical protein
MTKNELIKLAIDLMAVTGDKDLLTAVREVDYVNRECEEHVQEAYDD